MKIFQAHEYKATQMVKLESLLSSSSSPIIGIGEIGLDFSHKNHNPPMVQEVVFMQQLELANKMDLPVILHFRESYRKGLDILKNVINPLTPLHVHCFTSDWNTAQDFLANFRNVFFGFTGLITYPSAEETRAIVSKLPIERILLETDSPFFKMAKSNSRSFSLPQDIPIIGTELGELKRKGVNDILTQNIANSKKVYSKYFQLLDAYQN